ncbi:hypothetical protein GGG17_06635 [Arsenicicoccus sp. MKL-02]|uniref:Uncharacterized protein n=1 Tax=Arsenicicoccus cauae TaxID=2663847 RepID=A0A6I3ISJ8_9MICO|nr:hypothetical protein [Arsenicicoccus cauae]MTB71649.1 hypothetical protein [Arsenicicoccus cauae]
MRERLAAGRWARAVKPQSLQRVADAADLGGAAFVSYRAGAFVNDRADRDPYGPRRWPGSPGPGPRRGPAGAALRRSAAPP